MEYTVDQPLRFGWGSYTDDSMVIRRKSVAMQARAATAPEPEMIPDMEKRNIMNLILLSSVASAVGGLAGPFLYFFVPRTSGGSGGGLTAKDRDGNDVTLKGWMANHKAGDRQLVQGLKGDATYLISTEDGVKDFGINAVCTHLGCVVPWNKAENKYMCPCHGSQYDENGKVVRGPAPLSLALSHINIDESDKVVFTPWTEEDFRTGL